jgi:AcrR family transcriptional regulator
VPRKLTREESRERNHERLVDATIRLVNRIGVGALTTREIANLADLSQPAFYLYFRSIDEALVAAADKVSAHIRIVTREARLAAAEGTSRDVIRASYAAAVNAYLDEPGFVSLFLRHRRDVSTALGRKLSKLENEMRAELVGDFIVMGITETVIPQVELFAQLTIASVLAVVEGILDRRFKDVDVTIDALTDACIGTMLGMAAKQTKKDLWAQWAATLLIFEKDRSSQ